MRHLPVILVALVTVAAVVAVLVAARPDPYANVGWTAEIPCRDAAAVGPERTERAIARTLDLIEDLRTDVVAARYEASREGLHLDGPTGTVACAGVTVADVDAVAAALRARGIPVVVPG